MRREFRVSDQVFAHLYPNRRSTDPQSFTDYLNNHLVSEVRIETQRFYGGLETVEAKYPGLNYTHPPHIKRLSYFPHHKRLFEAFKELGLTESEILTLCRWEGTLWARQRYEKDEGIKVEDTTGDEIGPWVPPERRTQIQDKKTASATTSSRRSTRRVLSERRPAALPQTYGQMLNMNRPVEQQQSHQRPQTAPLAESPASRQDRAPRRQQEEEGDVVMHESQPATTFTLPSEDSGSSSSAAPSPHPVERAAAHYHQQQQLTADSSTTTRLTMGPADMLQRMRTLAILSARGETIDPSDPAFEQYLKDAEAGELSGGYNEAAQTIASVVGSVAHQAGNQVAQMEQAAGSGGAPAEGVREVDVL